MHGSSNLDLCDHDQIDARFVYGDMNQAVLADKFKFGLRQVMRDPCVSWNDRLKIRVGAVRWSEWLGMQWDAERTINRLRNRARMQERLEFMTAKAPHLQRGLMEERNDLLSLAMRDCDGELVVAVVGLDHMHGIEERFRNRFAGVDLEQYKRGRDTMMSEQGLERLDALCQTDNWIGEEFAEFKHSRDLPQKMI